MATSAVREASNRGEFVARLEAESGEPVEVVGFAPLGDPMEIRLRDYRLSLRRREAARVLVRPVA